MLRARIELTSSRPQRDILTTGRSEPNQTMKYFCSYMVINRCALHFVHKLRKKATCHYILTLGHPQRRHRNNTTASCMEINNQHHRYCVHRGIAIIVVASTSCEHVIVEGSK